MKTSINLKKMTNKVITKIYLSKKEDELVIECIDGTVFNITRTYANVVGDKLSVQGNFKTLIGARILKVVEDVVVNKSSTGSYYLLRTSKGHLEVMCTDKCVVQQIVQYDSDLKDIFNKRIKKVDLGTDIRFVFEDNSELSLKSEKIINIDFNGYVIGACITNVNFHKGVAFNSICMITNKQTEIKIIATDIEFNIIEEVS